DVPGVGHHRARRVPRLPRRLGEEVPRTKAGFEGELALGSLQVRHDLGLARRVALERQRLTFEAQLVAERAERRLGAPQLLEHAAPRLVVECTEDGSEVEVVRVDRLRDLHRQASPWASSRRASSSILPCASVSCAAQRRYSSSPRSQRLVSSSSPTSPRSSRSTIRSSSARACSNVSSLQACGLRTCRPRPRPPAPVPPPAA